MNKYIPHIFIIVYVIVCFTVRAEDESQTEIRENPSFEIDSISVSERTEANYPEYINIDSNRIEMNGADWSHLVEKFDSCSFKRLNIVHIGDSHLQADMATTVIRGRLGSHYGSAGRSLITPFKLAGTNEPADYSVTSSCEVVQSRLLKTPWPTEMRFTGIGVQPKKREFDVNISVHEPFDSVIIYFSGDSVRVLNEFRTDFQPGMLSIALNDTCSALNLKLSSETDVTLHGFNLICGNTGVAYHVIGNNGATFGTYNGISNFANDIKTLCPALIIVSLGTNEAFGKISDEQMTSQINEMIGRLKSVCPDSHFLLTTPAECQRRTYRGKGRNRRRTGFAVNSNVKRMRNVILDYARKENIPVYDFYEIAGGDGSSAKWLKDGKMNRDRIHLLKAGYTLQGHLFTDAFEEALQKFRLESN